MTTQTRARIAGGTNRRRLALAALTFCVAAAAQETKQPLPKEIYGNDDLIDLYQEIDPLHQAWAKSICALVPADFLIDEGGGVYALDEAATQQFRPLCDDEPFSSQPRGAACTAFMVGDDLIATAGHCVREGLFNTLIDFCSIRVVFGFDMLDDQTPVTTFSEDQVYSVTEVIAAAFNEWNNHDFAILRLDRPITAPGAVPLSLRHSGRASIGDKVGIMGHPLGLPLKIAFGADTEVYPAPDVFGGNAEAVFFTNFDACAGNSGSPVFNAETGEVEGIYTFSYVQDLIAHNDCYTINRVPNWQAAQGVTDAQLFVDIVDDARNGARGIPAPGCCAGVLKALPWTQSLASHSGDLLALLGATAILSRLRR